MNPVDVFIAKRLKRYASRQHPPKYSRIRLLHAASANRFEWAQNNRRAAENAQVLKKLTRDHQQSAWSLNYLDWSSIYFLGVLNLRHVL